MSECLVCKNCGYKQYDEQTVKYFKKIFKKHGFAIHDIPYFCSACQDNATDEEYLWMEEQMSGKNDYVVCESCRKVITDGRIVNSYKKLFPNIKKISDFPYRCKECVSVKGEIPFVANAKKRKSSK